MKLFVTDLLVKIHQVKFLFIDISETAQSHGGSGIQDAVLAVPPDFDSNQRNLVT